GGGVDPLVQLIQGRGQLVVEGVLVLAADLLDPPASGVRVLAQADLRAPELLGPIEVDRDIGSFGQCGPGRPCVVFGAPLLDFPGNGPVQPMPIAALVRDGAGSPSTLSGG